MNLKNFLKELKRRNVIKAGVSYAISSWIILQVLAIVLPTLGAEKYLRWALLLLVLGFPCWLIFSWTYELTSEGLEKTANVAPEDSLASKTGIHLNKILVVMLAIAILLLAGNIYVSTSTNSSEAQLPDQEESQNLKEDKSIAVLAFADMSPKKDQEYFSDGISEEILNLLSRIPDLKVISRTSSFSFKDENDVTTKEIGEILDVNHVLEGSVRKSGNNLRITAKLISTKDGHQIWSETFDREMEDIFAIQEEIAIKVTKELKATLIKGELETPVVDTKAYNLYLEAKEKLLQMTENSTQSAKHLVKESIAIDSTYAPSWVLLARINYRSAFNFQLMHRKVAVAEGMKAIKRALDLDPENAQAYNVKSLFSQMVWDFQAAANYAKKALKLAPNDPHVLRDQFVAMPTSSERIAFAKKAFEQDPLNYSLLYYLGIAYYFDGQLDAAEKAFNKYSLYYPNSDIVHFLKSRIKLAQGKEEDALEEVKMEPNEFFRNYGLTMVLYDLGKEEEANVLLEKFIKENTSEACNIADIYAFRGEKEKAFKWLERAVEIKDPTLTEAVYYPTFKILYDDPRWDALIRSLNFPENHGVPMGDQDASRED